MPPMSIQSWGLERIMIHVLYIRGPDTCRQHIGQVNLVVTYQISPLVSLQSLMEGVLSSISG